MLDFTAKAAGCTVFTKIDLRKGYHQIPVNPADVPKTAIVTPFGLFEYLRMGFGPVSYTHLTLPTIYSV